MTFSSLFFIISIFLRCILPISNKSPVDYFRPGNGSTYPPIKEYHHKQSMSYSNPKASHFIPEKKYAIRSPLPICSLYKYFTGIPVNIYIVNWLDFCRN